MTIYLDLLAFISSQIVFLAYTEEYILLLWYVRFYPLQYYIQYKS